MTDCPRIRELLPEHALGVLPPDERERVERHLAWCAGCRKEAGALADGAAAVGLAAAADPPAGLEDRVVAAMARRARSRRRPWGARVAAVVAAAVAAGSIGWAAAMAGRVQRLEEQAATAHDRADSAAQEFEAVLEQIGDRPLLSAPLTAPEGDAGGRAILFDGTGTDDFAVVIVGGLAPDRGPYRAHLASQTGAQLPVGRLVPSAEGQVARYRFFFEDVAGYHAIVVTDGSGEEILRGTFSADSK